MSNYPVHIVAAGGFVTNTNGQALMQKIPRYQDWEFPGGQVGEGETIPCALEREVFEETGIVVKVKSPAAGEIIYRRVVLAMPEDDESV